MFAIKPILVTVLLVVFLYSLYGILAAAVVFLVTIITTYICYSLKTQLRLEKLASLLKKYTTGVKKAPDILEGKQFDSLECFPQPIAKKLRKLTTAIVRDFVETWYVYIGPDEEDFIKEVKLVLELIIVQVYIQLQSVNQKELIVSLISFFQRHIKLFDDCRNIIYEKYPGISEEDFGICITELYEAGAAKHIATINKASEIDYLKTVLDVVMCRFLPKNAFSCEAGCFLLKEILANQLLEPIIKDLSESHFVNSILVDVLEPSIPMHVILQKWNDALEEDDGEENKDVKANLPHSVDNEDQICEKIEEAEETFMETSQQESCKSSISEKDFQQNSVFLHFNKFDERSSAPVYGMKSAREHEEQTKQSSIEKNSLDSLMQNDVSWDVCPNATSSEFDNKSFFDMPKNQDEILEQTKSKGVIIKQIIPLPISSLIAKQNIDKSLEVNLIEEDDTRSVEEDKLKNAFSTDYNNESFIYDDEFNEIGSATSGCPTCYEMTMLASPFKNEKGRLILNLEKKLKVSEHECGLKSQHFFFPAQTEQENITLDSPSNDSFTSCTEYQNELFSGNESVSSETLDISVVPEWVQNENEQISSLNEQIAKNEDNIAENISQSISTFKSVIDQCPPGKQTKKNILNTFAIFKPKKSKRNKVEKLKIPFNKIISRTMKTKKMNSKPAVKSFVDHENVESSSISTNITKFISIPEMDSFLFHRDTFVGDFIEEVALEAEEDDNSTLYAPSLTDLQVDPLSKAIAVTNKECDVKSVKSGPSNDSGEFSERKTGSVLLVEKAAYSPIFDAQVVEPRNSAVPSSTEWLYPILMVSIPLTELAYEKGWEPGINKYTLYNVHYDIRIWPDLYAQHLKVQPASNNEGPNTLPLIREIKRRYREFLYLHNRLTHGSMAVHMKGVLRPNRRYAMPFGRMDPDVIEGRRKILESYLVSLVSRSEICNSREFKDFLGSQDHDAYISPKKISKKQVYQPRVNKIITTGKLPDINSTNKEHGDNPQYFIHGYEVPRMFGYAPVYAPGKHSSVFFTRFIEPINSHSNSGGDSSLPYLSNEPHDTSTKLNDETTTMSVYDRDVHTLHIAAKFSEELAARLREENLALAIACEKDLFESSWPLTNAILSVLCQALKGYSSWLTFERVQQSILFSLGGIIEWLIEKEINEVTLQPRCYKYLCDLYSLIWDEQDQLRPKDPVPNPDERFRMKEKVFETLLHLIPSCAVAAIGMKTFKECFEKVLHTLQYERINKHVIYTALELILLELIPEIRR